MTHVWYFQRALCGTLAETIWRRGEGLTHPKRARAEKTNLCPECNKLLPPRSEIHIWAKSKLSALCGESRENIWQLDGALVPPRMARTVDKEGCVSGDLCTQCEALLPPVTLLRRFIGFWRWNG